MMIAQRQSQTIRCMDQLLKRYTPKGNYYVLPLIYLVESTEKLTIQLKYYFLSSLARKEQKTVQKMLELQDTLYIIHQMQRDKNPSLMRSKRPKNPSNLQSKRKEIICDHLIVLHYSNIN